MSMEAVSFDVISIIDERNWPGWKDKPIDVELCDANGLLNPTADQLLSVSAKGPTEIIAFRNVDIKDCDRYTNLSHHT